MCHLFPSITFFFLVSSSSVAEPEALRLDSEKKLLAISLSLSALIQHNCYEAIIAAYTNEHLRHIRTCCETGTHGAKQRKIIESD